MERRELIERLVPLIPSPRAHQVRYHGVLAPCASMRRKVVPAPCIERGGPAPDGDPLADGFPDGSRSEASGANPPPASRPDPAAEAPSTGPESSPEDHVPARSPPASAPEGRTRSPRRFAWAELLQRVFAVDALRCPRCGSTLRLVAAIEDPVIARRILECIGLPARVPPLAAAAPDSGGIEPSPVDPDEPWAFDQTPPGDDSWA